ncbi:DUF6221 family protein [Nocardia abscessus]|uniref:DUF6221 family protein n=1 Tax=Nocardia abscessus TaxID=120957 RepID=UPI00245597CA|nr:DUF6221 family protein [Nocardia abscessus]
MTIAEFIATRLDEADYAARSAMHQPDAATPERWAFEYGGAYGPHMVIRPAAQRPEDREVSSADDALAAKFVAEQDPAFVLRRVDRDRRVLARHSAAPVTAGVRMVQVAGGQPGETCVGCGWRGNGQGPTAWPCVEVRDLAEVWADHPDYRQEWRE